MFEQLLFWPDTENELMSNMAIVFRSKNERKRVGIIAKYRPDLARKIWRQELTLLQAEVELAQADIK